MPQGGASSERVLILAPHGRDAEIASALLIEAGNPTYVCCDLEHLRLELEKGAAFVVVTEEAVAESAVHNQLEQWEKAGYGHLTVCIAKTQYSFSTDPELRGAPSGHVVPVREVRLAAGAGFIVAICGKITTMPGLPRSPAAERIFLNDQGEIEGLF